MYTETGQNNMNTGHATYNVVRHKILWDTQKVLEKVLPINDTLKHKCTLSHSKNSRIWKYFRKGYKHKRKILSYA